MANPSTQRGRRLATRLAQALLGLVLLPVVLFALVLAVLQLEPVRRQVGDRLIGLANGAMDWKLELSGYKRLNPWGVHVEHVLLYDDHHRLVVDAHGVDATIDLWQLLDQHVDIGSARVDRALLKLPMVTEPTPPKSAREEAEDAADDDTPSGWRVTIPRAAVGDCRLDMALPIGQLRAHARAVDGEFHWHDDYRIVVREAELTGDLDGKRTLTAKLTDSDWRSDTGGDVVLRGTLGSGPLAARARLSGIDVPTPWPQGSLSLTAERVGPATLALFRLERDWLARPVDLSVEVRGDDASFRVQSVLGLDRKNVVLSGAWSREALELSVKLPRLAAERLSPRLPSGTLGGQLRARYALDKAGVMEASWRQLVVADVLLPDGRVRGKKRAELLTFEGLKLTGYEQNLTADGQLGLRSKSARAHAHIRGFDLAKLEVLRGERLAGVVDGELHLSLPKQGSVQLQSRLQVQRLHLRSLHADRVVADLTGSGAMSEPTVEGSLSVEGLRVPRLPLNRVRLTGGFAAGKGRAHIAAKGQRLSVVLDVNGQQRAEGFDLQGKGTLEQEREKLALTFEGRKERSDYSLATQLSGSGELSARLAQSARGLTVDLTADALKLAPLLALLSLEEQQAELDGSLHVEIPARRGALSLRDAQLRADLEASLPIAPLMGMTVPALASLSGTLDAELRAQGTLAEPHVELRADAKVQLPERDDKPERLELVLTVAPDSAEGQVVLSDLDGRLLVLNGQLGEPVHQLVDELSRNQQLPSFALSAEILPRRLDLMQGVIAYLAGVYAFDLPLKLAGKLSVRGRDSELSGDAALRVRLFGDAIDDSCMAGAFTDLDVTAQLERGDLELRAAGFGDKGGKLTAELRSRFNFQRSNGGNGAASTRGGPLTLEPATVKVVADKVALHTLPGLCALAGGVGTGQVTFEGVGAAGPTAKAALSIKGLAAGRAPPLDVTLTSELSRSFLSGEARVQSKGKRAAEISFRLPVEQQKALPGLDLVKPGRASVKLAELPVAPFLSVGEQLGRPRGTVAGQLFATGSLSDPKLDGYIDLKRVGLSIASIAQPLREIEGRIEVHGRKLSVRGLSARDGEGKLRVDGYAQLARDWSGDLQLQARAERFPVRRQGEVVGELSTKVGFTGKLDSQLDLTGDVRVREGRFWLTGERGSTVQSLEKHAEIHFVDARGKADEEKEAKAEAESAKDPRRSLSLTELRVRTDKDIWFQHSDFSVQLGIDMKLLQEDGDEKLVGEVRITRGQLQLIGKPFDIQRGSVRLTGDYPPDPELELKASFEPPSGQKLFVEVHGRASSPIVAFSGAASTAEEAVAIVSGLGTVRMGAEQRVQSDARGFATNLTAGLLSATARRRLGDWVPLISVQSDVTGAPAQARAGFDASKLIPPFLRPLARGAYVEGIVGNTRQKRSGAVGLGVRVEVALPRDFVSSMGYGPGPTWATDLSWVP